MIQKVDRIIKTEGVELSESEESQEVLDYKAKRFQALEPYALIFKPYGFNIMDQSYTPRLKELSMA